jgi:cyclic pyranopterin phosphate synthase
MVDVTGKPNTERKAMARGRVRMKGATIDLIKKREIPKGDVLAVARVAGIMAAKRTPDIIPLCHPLFIGNIKIDFEIDENSSAVIIVASVKSIGKTGVEMEALIGVAAAALSIYDMCKAVDRGIIIEDIRLTAKSGGKSGVINFEQDR